MHSIIDKNNKCVGQYIFIKDDKYSTRIFTRYYNMCINQISPITKDVVRDLVKMEKYKLENTIHIYDLNTDEIVLKHLVVGDVMIYLNKNNKLYLASEDELNKFLESNEYSSRLSIIYIIGIPNSGKFENVRPVSSNTVENAKQIYRGRYEPDKDPVVIGVKNAGHLFISLNDHILESEIDEENIINHNK